MKYGASYYPEQYGPGVIVGDIELMRQAGFNVVRMGEFAWSRLEPREGAYDFGWLDEAVETLGRAGIQSILCTPTACPPAWLTEKHPEILYRDNRGVVRPFGGRRHYCYNSEVYREYCRRIAAAVAERYGGNDHVLGFQIVNDAAVCFDYDSLWSSRIKPFHREFDYAHYCAELHRCLAKAGIGADVVPCTDAVKRYRLVILPVAMILRDSFRETLREYVESGGTVLMTFLSSIRDAFNNAPEAQSFPAGLTGLFGVRVGEGEPVVERSAAEVRLTLGGWALTGAVTMEPKQYLALEEA